MNLNENNRHVLPLKTHENKEHTFILNSKSLLYKKNKDLGIFMTPELSWKLNAHKRSKEAWKAFYFFKIKMSTLTSKMTKLEAYSGYVIPALSHASPTWFANKTDTKSRERIQRKASRILTNLQLQMLQRTI